MRLAFCYHCESMVKLTDYVGNPDYDDVLTDWIKRHEHGLDTSKNPGEPGAHPGGRVFTMDTSKSDVDRRVYSHVDPRKMQTMDDDANVLGELSADEMEFVQASRAELRKIGKEVNDYRDELRTESVACHQKHGQPSYPGKPCIDYQADSKRLGRRETPKPMRQYLCTYCPYESTVVVVKRANRGDYKEGAGQRRRRR